MRNSIWTDQVKAPKHFDALTRDVKTDVLIIGGGITGILCAYYLKKNGIDYILTEGNKIASGITKNTTAKITIQHALIYDKLISEFGYEKASMYLKANTDALNEYKDICKKISCDFEIKNSYVYSINNRRKLENEAKALNSLNLGATYTESLPLPFKTAGGVEIKQQAQFNPLKFIYSLSKDLNIYENTFIYDISNSEAISNYGKIRFNKAIISTHFPFINKYGGYFLKLYQHRSYVSLYKNISPPDGMYVDENQKGISLRSFGDLLLISGGSHRTGKTGGTWREVNNFANEFYPGGKLISEWATQDCMSLDGIPYIGQYSKHTTSLYVACGFNKWGMTSAMISAKILSNMINDKQTDYSEVFSPQRNSVKPQLFINGFETTKSLLTPTLKRCPHLGCALKWNSAEHSWDCPCHGSRFEKNGKIIDNPSIKNLE